MKRCPYMPSYECICEYPDCLILKYPPGTFPVITDWPPEKPEQKDDE